MNLPSRRASDGRRIDVERIRRIPIAQVATDLGFRLSQSGSGLCRLPGHDDHKPSFSLRLRSNSFQCYACRRGGSVIDLVMFMEELDFLPACRWLRKHYLGEHDIDGDLPRRGRPAARKPTKVAEIVDHILAPDPELYDWIIARSPLGAKGREYLAARGFSEETLAIFRIGQVSNRSVLRRAAFDNFGEKRLRRCGLLRDGRWGAELVFPSNYLLFPFLTAGAVTYLQARRPDAGSEYRWFCPAGLLPPAFNLDVLDQGHATVLICEGVTDTLSAHEMGHAAVGLVGANAHLDQATIDRLRGHNVVLIGDRDPAGQSFARDTVRLLSRQGITAVTRQLPVGTNDINDLLRQQRGLA